MKTAMRELIKHIEEAQEENFISDLEYVKEFANTLLEREKRQLGMAFTDGFYAGCDQPMFDDMPLKYYLKTYSEPTT